MHNQYMDMMENLLETSAAFSGLSSTLAVLAYVFSSLALYTIAQRRDIRKAWLAWVPVVNVWILGSISDQYRYVAKGEVKSRRKILLAVNLAKAVLGLAMSVRLAAMIFQAVFGMTQGYGESAMMEILMSGLTTLLLLGLPAILLALLGMVFEIMALYDVYTSCEPANNTLYLILSVIPGISRVTRPLFLFLCRNQDDGMPPRREAAAAETDYVYEQGYGESPCQEQ